MLRSCILLLFFIFEGLGQDCPVRNEALLENGRSCRKSCQSDSECRGKLKSCNCDDVCGRSCFNPNALCFPPEQIENGEINGRSFTYGSIITYTCSDGFVINGAATRRCRSDRKWSGLPPLCQVGCRSPTFERNSYSNSRKDNYYPGETLQYTCRPGYRLTGDEIRTCRGNGKWTPIRFDCIRRSCLVPPEPDNGYTEGEDYVFGSRVVYHCSRGHQLTKSQNYITCGLSNGHPDWITQDRNGEFPQCKSVECPAPISPDNGEVELIGDKTFGAVIRYSCNSGFTIEGNVIARCNENRSWGEIPSCVEPTCTISPYPLHSSISPNVTTVRKGHKVTISCDYGYYISDAPLGTKSRVLTCGSKSTWFPDVPRCELSTCTTPSSPLHSSISPDVATAQYGLEIIVSCDDGYYISDAPLGTKSRVLTCGLGNTWFPNMPRGCEQQALCADNGRPCVFPFRYGKRNYNRCKKFHWWENGSGAWCATTNNYNVDSQYGNCIVCPNEWDHWNSWSLCSLTCGEGTQNRQRRCWSTRYGPGSVYCPGSNVDIRSCNHGICPPDVDPCDEHPCSNGGSCFSTGGKFYCVCRKGYNGNHCENRI